MATHNTNPSPAQRAVLQRIQNDRVFMNNPVMLQGLGLAPIVVKGIFDIIREINKQGVTVLLIEQNANMALRIADIGYVLETGKIITTGPGKQLLNDPAIKAAYLGT